MDRLVHVGLDVGSTTVKVVVLNSQGDLLYSKYKRHYADIRKTVSDIIAQAYQHFSEYHITIMTTGSGGLSISKWLDIGFIQEVVACAKTVEKVIQERMWRSSWVVKMRKSPISKALPSTRG